MVCVFGSLRDIGTPPVWAFQQLWDSYGLYCLEIVAISLNKLIFIITLV